jgi:hypothetical protein
VVAYTTPCYCCLCDSLAYAVHDIKRKYFDVFLCINDCNKTNVN